VFFLECGGAEAGEVSEMKFRVTSLKKQAENFRRALGKRSASALIVRFS
jgi:hypothetical protein